MSIFIKDAIRCSITGSAGSVAWSNVTDKPSSYTPSEHTHGYWTYDENTIKGVKVNNATSADTATCSYGVYDYNTDTATRLDIGYSGTGLTSSTCSYLAGYGTNAAGRTCIKDISKAEVKTWLGLGSLAYKNSLTASDVGAATSTHTHTTISNALTVSGNLYATAFYESSDERLKDFKDDIEVDIKKLKDLKKKYFTFKDNPDKLEIGVSAQEIQAVYPEIVSENEDGYLTVAYDKLSVVALKAVDKLDDEITELKDRMSRLEEMINKLIENK